MAAAELSLADLHQMVQATIQQSKAVSDAGAATAERVNELQDSLDKYAASSAKAFDALATTTTGSLARTESTLGRVLVAHNSLDAAVAEMRKSLEGIVRLVDTLEQPAHSSQLQDPLTARTKPLQTNRQGAAQQQAGNDFRGLWVPSQH